MVAFGAGERAAAMAEQLAFEQILRDGGAVERNEGFAAAVRMAMDRARDNLLAGAAFSGEHDARARRGDTPGQAHDLAHASRDDGLVAVAWEFFERPQREPLFAFDPTAFKVPDDLEEHGDGVDGGDRLDVESGLTHHFHDSSPKRAKRVGLLWQRTGVGRVRACVSGEHLDRAITAAGHRDGANNRVGSGENFHDAARQQFRLARSAAEGRPHPARPSASPSDCRCWKQATGGSRHRWHLRTTPH